MLNNIKVNSVKEAKEELAFRKKSAPKLLHRTMFIKGALVVKSSTFTEYINEKTNNSLNRKPLTFLSQNRKTGFRYE